MPQHDVDEHDPRTTPPQRRFDPRIVACYLYPITRYGYPPPGEGTERCVEEQAGLGFRSIELEGIHAPHLRAMQAPRGDVRRTLDNGSLPATLDWKVRSDDLGATYRAACDVADLDRAYLDAAYLISTWVAPEARGRGVGAALVGAFGEWARGRGYRRVVLDVAERNAWARRLYERCGFVATGATGTLPPPREHVVELEMALDLTVAGRALADA